MQPIFNTINCKLCNKVILLNDMGLTWCYDCNYYYGNFFEGFFKLPFYLKFKCSLKTLEIYTSTNDIIEISLSDFTSKTAKYYYNKITTWINYV